jgi:acyl carrier protein
VVQATEEFLRYKGGHLDIRSEIRNFIFDNFMMGKENEQLSDTDSLLGMGVIDSTGVLELVGFLEDHFKVTVEADETIPDNFDSVNSLINYIQSKRG